MIRGYSLQVSNMNNILHTHRPNIKLRNSAFDNVHNMDVRVYIISTVHCCIKCCLQNLIKTHKNKIVFTYAGSKCSSYQRTKGRNYTLEGYARWWFGKVMYIFPTFDLYVFQLIDYCLT